MSFEKWFNENYNKVSDVRISKELTKKRCLIVWQAAQPQWQPIETAPRSGKRFLVYFDGGMIKICFFMREDTEAGLEFLFEDGDFLSLLKRGYNPTCWQPLPSPPAESKND